MYVWCMNDVYMACPPKIVIVLSVLPNWNKIVNQSINCRLNPNLQILLIAWHGRAGRTGIGSMTWSKTLEKWMLACALEHRQVWVPPPPNFFSTYCKCLIFRYTLCTLILGRLIYRIHTIFPWIVYPPSKNILSCLLVLSKSGLLYHKHHPSPACHDFWADLLSNISHG